MLPDVTAVCVCVCLGVSGSCKMWAAGLKYSGIKGVEAFLSPYTSHPPPPEVTPHTGRPSAAPHHRRETHATHTQTPQTGSSSSFKALKESNNPLLSHLLRHESVCQCWVRSEGGGI